MNPVLVDYRDVNTVLPDYRNVNQVLPDCSVHSTVRQWSGLLNKNLEKHSYCSIMWCCSWVCRLVFITIHWEEAEMAPSGDDQTILYILLLKQEASIKPCVKDSVLAQGLLRLLSAVYIN